MRNLYFEDRFGERRKIGEANDLDEASPIIHNFLNEHSFKSYYMNIWVENDEMYIDVGSHSEFFVLSTK